MGFSSFFSKQARKPEGIFGRFFMSRVFEKGNLELNRFVKEALCVKRSDRILEIGCGTGATLKCIADELESGCIEGIDFSETMLSIAGKKNKKHISRQKALIRPGDFNLLLFEENSYDKIYSVNTIYFWKDPESTLSRIADLLKPGGMAVLGFHNRDEMETMDLDENIFRLYSPEDVSGFMQKHGSFKEVKILSHKGQKWVNYCAVGIKA